MASLPWTTLALLFGALTFAYLLLERAKPRPIPGIPCDAPAAKSPLGDIPALVRYVRDTAEYLTWYVKRCEELDSPIIQTFMQPFTKPFVVVNDARESFDILTRRTREFDQSDLFRDTFGALFPNSSATFHTGDRWSKNRRLVSETMSPSFLHNVASPIVYAQSLELVKLWQAKSRLANGRPFPAQKDVERATYDIIWNIAFGDDLGASRAQTEYLSELHDVGVPESMDDIVTFPELPLPEPFWALNQIVESAKIILGSPFGQLHHKLAKTFYPGLSRAWRIKDGLVRGAITRAWENFATEDAEHSKQSIRSAVDFIINREAKQARKEGRAPETHGKYLEGELTMYVGSGFETTAATTCWALKYLSAYSDVREKLRSSLREAFPEALEKGVNPSAMEIAEANLVYLDAFVDEVLRHSFVIPLNSRTAVVDTTILGYPIPKGTTVLLPTRGPPTAKAIAESLRTESSKEFREVDERWRLSDMDQFRPERWLSRDSNTERLEHNGQAAPMLAFGGGTRVCFGRKLALLEVRTLMALIVWNFDLQDPPGPLSTFKGVDVVTHKPEKVFLRLAEDANAPRLGE